jgi:hypothetical protein
MKKKLEEVRSYWNSRPYMRLWPISSAIVSLRTMYKKQLLEI